MFFGHLLSSDTTLFKKDQLNLTWQQPREIHVCSSLLCVILDLKRFSLANIETGLCFETVDIARFSVCQSISWSKLDQPKISIMFLMDIL